MQNTKLIKLLKTFSKTEIDNFRKFVVSPYFNKNKKVIALAELIIKQYPDFDSDKLNEEQLHNSVFKNEKYDYFKIKNLTSDIFALVMSFLKYQSVYFTEFTPEINLIVNLRSKEHNDLHKKAILAAEKKLENGKIKDGYYLYNKFLIADEKQISEAKDKPNSTKGMQDVFNAQFELSLLNLLKQYSLLTHVSIENNIRFELTMYDKILEYIKSEEKYENITLKAYRFIMLLLAEKEVKYYEGLKNIYFKFYENLDPEDSYMALFYLNSFCAERYNLFSDKKYIHELRDLFKYAFEKDAVALGSFHYPDFVHYMKIFIRAGDFDTAEKFKRKYFDLIASDQKDNVLNHTQALLEYKKGNFETALGYLSKVNYPAFIMKLQVKITQLQLLIETEKFEESRFAILAFKQFLFRESVISKTYKSIISKFLKLCLELVKICESDSLKIKKKELALFKKSAERLEANHFGIRLWLIDKSESN